jgi:hypothetical protein
LIKSFYLIETVFAIVVISLAISTLPNLYKTVSETSHDIVLKEKIYHSPTNSKTIFIDDSYFLNLEENRTLDLEITEVGNSSLKLTILETFDEKGEKLFQFHTFSSEVNLSSLEEEISIP